MLIGSGPGLPREGADVMRRPEFIARQARQPSGPFGYIVAWIMARETACDNAHTLDLLGISEGDRILEVGCGHGATLGEVVERASNTRVTGLDFSQVMVNVARERNDRLIAEGRVKIELGDSASLRYGNESFEKVFSVHTLYFWSEPEQHLREICRVLVPGGRLVLGFRSGEDQGTVSQFPSSVYRFRTGDEVAGLAARCGFGGVRIVSENVCDHTMTWLIAEKSGDV